MLVERHIRFRNDQLEKFAKIQPDKSLAEVVRMLLDEYLGGKTDDEARLEEIDELIETNERQVRILRLEKAELEQKRQVAEAEQSIEVHRQQYIADNPRILHEYRTGTISTKGWSFLQRELKFSSKAKVIEWLEAQT